LKYVSFKDICGLEVRELDFFCTSVLGLNLPPYSYFELCLVVSYSPFLQQLLRSKFISLCIRHFVLVKARLPLKDTDINSFRFGSKIKPFLFFMRTSIL